MKERVKEIIDWTGLSVRKFALDCGLAQQTIDKQIKGISSISLETVTAILATYPQVSAEWLMRGEGQMLASDNQQAQDKRIDQMLDVIAMQQEIIKELKEKK